MYITENTSERELYNGNRPVSTDSLTGDLQEVWIYLFIPAYHDRLYIDRMRFSCVFFFCPFSQWPYPTQILPYVMKDDILPMCCPGWFFRQLPGSCWLCPPLQCRPRRALWSFAHSVQNFPWTLGKDPSSLSLSCSQILSDSVTYFTHHSLNDNYFPLYLTVTPRFENTDSWRSPMNERSVKVMHKIQNCCFWNDGFRSVKSNILGVLLFPLLTSELLENSICIYQKIEICKQDRIFGPITIILVLLVTEWDHECQTFLTAKKFLPRN